MVLLQNQSLLAMANLLLLENSLMSICLVLGSVFILCAFNGLLILMCNLIKIYLPIILYLDFLRVLGIIVDSNSLFDLQKQCLYKHDGSIWVRKLGNHDVIEFLYVLINLPGIIHVLIVWEIKYCFYLDIHYFYKVYALFVGIKLNWPSKYVWPAPTNFWTEFF